MQCFKAANHTILRSFVMAAMSSYLRTSVTLIHRPLPASPAILHTVCVRFADSVRCVRVGYKKEACRMHTDFVFWLQTERSQKLKQLV